MVKFMLGTHASSRSMTFIATSLFNSLSNLQKKTRDIEQALRFSIKHEATEII